MFNEVSKSCPKCGKVCTVQIAQLVMGFGEFSLDHPEVIYKKLPDPEDQELLIELANEEGFHCSKHGAYVGTLEIQDDEDLDDNGYEDEDQEVEEDDLY